MGSSSQQHPQWPSGWWLVLPARPGCTWPRPCTGLGEDRGWMGWGTSECSVFRECSMTSLKCSPSSSTRAYSDRVLNLERPSDGRGPKRNLPVVKPPQSYIHFPLFSNCPATNPIVYKNSPPSKVLYYVTKYGKMWQRVYSPFYK